MAELSLLRAYAPLRRELDRAIVVSSAAVPPDIATMNSRLRYTDEKDGATRTVALVYPIEADAAKGKVSVLAPVGTALLGLGSDRLRLLLRNGGLGPLATLAAARAAAALRPRGFVLGCYSGRCDGRFVTYLYCDWSGGLCRRLLPLRLVPAKPFERQMKSSLRARKRAAMRRPPQRWLSR